MDRRVDPSRTESAPVSRRRFMQWMGGALSLAALPSCRPPVERILPYVDQPPELVPGEPIWYATSMVLDGFATGLLVESREGRPIKIEGNPLHPASLGGTGVQEQASILGLYDPDRARFPMHEGSRVTVPELLSRFTAEVLPTVGARGSGLHLLLPPTSSPTDAALLDRWRTRFPDAGLHFYAPFASDAGSVPPALLPQYDLTRTRVIFAAEADFLGRGPFHLRYARDLAAARDPGEGMNRLYVLESGVTLTGAMADHRFAARPSEIPGLLSRLSSLVEGRAEPASEPEWLNAAARDLLDHRGASAVFAGDTASSELSALADRLNDALGNAGNTTWHVRSPLYGAGDASLSLSQLVEAMGAGAVRVLVVLGGNPCFATPGELDFAGRFEQVPSRLYAGTHPDETALRSQWFLPLAHYLESWGDAQAWDGTPSIIQPLIQPLYESLSSTGILAALLSEPRSPYDLVRRRWDAQLAGGAADRQAGWTRVLATGLLGSGSVPRVSRVIQDVIRPSQTSSPNGSEFELVLVPDYGIHDGTFAENPWLQELPRPLTTLTWGNAAHLSPGTAEFLGVKAGDRLEIERAGRRITVPALVVPGIAERTVVLALGFGRRAGGRTARGVGVDGYPLLPPERSGALPVQVRRVSGSERLALTQTHWTLADRDPARVLTRAEAESLPPRNRKLLPTLYEPPIPVPGTGGEHQWAMVIDLGRCTGCSACVIACQAENNIPTVGRGEVLNRREMHWIRVDQYLTGKPEEPIRLSQPMLCQHCEQAPCEYVCPVEATTHSPDGLNEMTYNRCVGTRFCSNNCPYKVRRFNWFDYHRELSEVERLAKNPHVTVRERGVMEKCTFCVQRIREAGIHSRMAGRDLRGEDVRTACQQACPSEAIRFGSLTEPESPVVRLREEPRGYNVLEELGTRPRVRYLARVRNPNPLLRGGG